MSTVLILTTTVNVNYKKSYLFQTSKEERIETYLRSVLQWLNKTNLKIILVDNSGHTYEELNNEKEKYKHRFEVISFIENELEEAKYLENNDSKGASELFSINYAFFHSKIVKNTDFIIKITGRYFISEFEEYLSNYDLNNYDCLIQNKRHYYKRCEIVGSHYTKFFYIFNIFLLNSEIQYNGHVESIYFDRTSQFKNIFECKILNIEKTQRGGLEECFTCL